MLKLWFRVSLAIVLIYSKAFAQVDPYSLDAFRFSQSQLHGSARTLGFAGAQTALGADLGSLSSNPAGLGFYRKSEYSIAPSFQVASTNSSVASGNGIAGTTVPDNKATLNMNNMGIAFCNLRDDNTDSKWRGGTFAIGMMRVANFQNTYSYSDTNSKSSVADYLTSTANSTGYNYQNYNQNNPNGLIDAAYGSYVFSPTYNFSPNGLDSTFTGYKDNVPPGTKYLQTESVNEKGGMNEWTAGYGGNYNNRFFFGASLALVTMRYERIRNYSEQALNNLNVTNVMTDININDDLKARGTGVNLTLGVTTILNDYIRTGLSLKTPTYMGIHETYNATVTADYANLNTNLIYGAANMTNHESTTTLQQNTYSVISPLKVAYGLALFADKYGFLSGDIEYANYSAAFIGGGSNSTSYITTNQNIKQSYQGTFNYKLGGELRVASIFRLRAGYALLSSPWQSSVQNSDRAIRSTDMQVLTCGFGVHTNDFFLDLAFNRSSYLSNYSPYSTPTPPQVTTSNALYNIVIGGGVFF